MSGGPIVILGGGLSGLYAAYLLKQRGIDDYRVLEARLRLGGRLFSQKLAPVPGAEHVAAFDLGATWFWPGLQPEVEALVRSLDLTIVAQHERGAMLFEESPLEPPRPLPSQASALPPASRVLGGMGALVEALASHLSPERLLLGYRATAVVQDAAANLQVRGEIVGGQPFAQQASHVLLALPPRLLAQSIGFTPALPVALHKSWSDCATWMAPHAKYVAVYPEPFWRERGLSGAAHSRAGPMVEIHDASPGDGLGALFGFIGVPALARQRITEEALLQACRNQLQRLFGPAAAVPLDDWSMDWAREPFTATSADGHAASQYGSAPAATASGGVWRSHITGIASEWSPQFPGYVAGCVDAVTRGLESLQTQRRALRDKT